MVILQMDKNKVVNPKSACLNPLTYEQLTKLARVNINLGISRYRLVAQGYSGRFKPVEGFPV